MNKELNKIEIQLLEIKKIIQNNQKSFLEKPIITLLIGLILPIIVYYSQQIINIDTEVKKSKLENIQNFHREFYLKCLNYSHNISMSLNNICDICFNKSDYDSLTYYQSKLYELINKESESINFEVIGACNDFIESIGKLYEALEKQGFNFEGPNSVEGKKIFTHSDADSFKKNYEIKLVNLKKILYKKCILNIDYQ